LSERVKGELSELSERELFKALFEQVYGRTLAGYWGAHATLISEAFERGATEVSLAGKADGEVERAPVPSALPIPEHLRPAFEALWAQGVVGQYLVNMIVLTGGADYEFFVPSLAQREVVMDVPIDVEAAEIAARFSRASAWESLFSNLQAMIPVAGVWISVPYGVYSQFKQRFRLTLELSALYGLNPRDPNDFLLSVQLLTAAQGFKELFNSMFEGLIGSQSYHLLSERRPDLLTDSFSERRVSEVLKTSLAQLAIVGARMLASLGDEALLSSGKALLNQVTFGVAALADITLDYFNTRFIARELRYALHPWGWATYLEAMPLIADPDYRRCAHSALVALAQADGDVSQREARLMLNALIRPFDASEEGAPDEAVRVQPSAITGEVEWVSYSNPDVVMAHLREAMDEGDYLLCMSDTWADEDSLTQLSLLSWLEVMAHADETLDPLEERTLELFGEQFEVKKEEQRVYDMMRARVAASPVPYGDLNSALWTWSTQPQSLLEAVTSYEMTLEVWAALRSGL
jgi:uncharacterized tellurite resistance protein B-like protein